MFENVFFFLSKIYDWCKLWKHNGEKNAILYNIHKLIREEEDRRKNMKISEELIC